MPEQTPNPQDTQKSNPAKDVPVQDAVLPGRLEPLVERKRILALGKNVGKLEQSVERIDARIGSLPGATPESIEREWDKVKKQVAEVTKQVDASLTDKTIDFAALESELKGLASSLAVIDGVLDPHGMQPQQTEVMLPNASVIAYDPRDVSGIAALSGIFALSQDPEKVDQLLKKLGVDQRREDESFGQALQRSMLKSLASPPTTDEQGVDTAKQPPVKSITPTPAGDFIGGKKK